MKNIGFLKKTGAIILSFILLFGTLIGENPFTVKAADGDVRTATVHINVYTTGTGPDFQVMASCDGESQEIIIDKKVNDSAENEILYTFSYVIPDNFQYSTMCWTFNAKDMPTFDCTFSGLDSADTVELTKDYSYARVDFMNGAESLETHYVTLNSVAPTPAVTPEQAGKKFDGWVTDPDNSTAVYDFSQRLTGPLTLYAYFVDEDGAEGGDGTEVEEGTVLPPTPSLNQEETYTENQTLELTAAEGASIYYTTDETEPTMESGIPYTDAIAITGVAGQSVTKTVKAIAVLGDKSSAVAVFTYTIDLPEQPSDHEHEWSTEWDWDEDGHWHNCEIVNCPITENAQKEGYAAHTEGEGTVTVEPAISMEGTLTYKCSTCGHSLREEMIPALDIERITSDIVVDESAPNMEFVTSLDDLVKSVLKPEESLQVSQGTDVKIWLTVTDAESIVTTDERAEIHRVLPDYLVGQYLDITLRKAIGDDPTPIRVPEADGMIRFRLTIPENLRNTDSGIDRSFGIARIHDGVTTLLPDLDKAEGTITFESDVFSTYAIVYMDTVKGGQDNNDSTEDNNSSMEDKNNSTEDKNNSTEDKNNSTEDKNNSTEDKNNSTEDNNSSTEDNNSTTNNNNITDSNNNSNSNTNKDNTANKNNSSNETTGKRGSTGPKTGDDFHIEFFATLSMIAGLTYLLLFFMDRNHGMTETEKDEWIARITAWARKGSWMRKFVALTGILILLVYYHSIGRQVRLEWKNV